MVFFSVLIWNDPCVFVKPLDSLRDIIIIKTREFSICSIFSVVCYSPCRMFQMNFEEHQNGAMSIRRLFGMLFVFKTVAIEEINMGTFMA